MTAPRDVGAREPWRLLPFWIEPDRLDVVASSARMVEVPNKIIDIRHAAGVKQCCQEAVRLSYRESGVPPEPGDWLQCRFCGNQVRIVKAERVYGDG